MKKKSSVAVIGAGFVGGSLAQVLAEQGFTVYNYDITGKMAPGTVDWQTLSQGKINRFLTPKLSDFVATIERGDPNFNGIYFVCLPTPMDLGDGHADLSIVDGVLKELSQIPNETSTQRIAVVKSTVPPGSTEAWNAELNPGLYVIFNPEFLREATALDDMRHQTRIVLGGPRPHINRVKQFYQSAFPNVPLVKTSSTTAEMVKYVTNIHLMVKVALANEFYQICEALDHKGMNIDYDKVIEYATLDERLGKSHWSVPGPMPDDITGLPAYGAGGSCFIKDINALIFISRSLGIDPKVMLGAWNKNLEVRPQRDWEKLVGRATSGKKKDEGDK